MDRLLLRDAQLQEDVFLLLRHPVVLCSLYSFSSHLLNKCNYGHPLANKARKTYPSLFTHLSPRRGQNLGFWEGRREIASQFKFNERHDLNLLCKLQKNYSHLVKEMDFLLVSVEIMGI